MHALKVFGLFALSLSAMALRGVIDVAFERYAPGVHRDQYQGRYK